MTEEIPKVYYDLDEVLFHFCAHLFNWFKLPIHEPTEWNDKRIRLFLPEVEHEAEFWLTMPVKEPVLSIPASGYLTARAIQNLISITALSNNNFDIAPCRTMEPGQSKHSFLPEGAVLVDDSPHVFESCHKAGKMCILYSRPYNLHIETPYRINNLSELPGKLRDHGIIRAVAG